MANIIQINGYTISSSNTGGGISDFPYTGSAIISGSLIVTGSTTSTLGFTGSLFGTSSWATNALSLRTGSSTIIGDTGILNISTPRLFLTGSIGTTIFGNNGIDLIGTITSYGNILPGGPYTNNTSSFDLGSKIAAWKDIYVSNGSLNFISGSVSASIQFNNGNITFPGATVIIPTGSIVPTASFAQTASFLLGSVTSASYAETASYVNTLNQDVTITGTLTIGGEISGIQGQVTAIAMRNYLFSGF